MMTLKCLPVTPTTSFSLAASHLTLCMDLFEKFEKDPNDWTLYGSRLDRKVEIRFLTFVARSLDETETEGKLFAIRILDLVDVDILTTEELRYPIHISKREHDNVLNADRCVFY